MAGVRRLRTRRLGDLCLPYGGENAREGGRSAQDGRVVRRRVHDRAVRAERLDVDAGEIEDVVGVRVLEKDDVPPRCRVVRRATESGFHDDEVFSRGRRVDGMLGSAMSATPKPASRTKPENQVTKATNAMTRPISARTRPMIASVFGRDPGGGAAPSTGGGR